LLLPTNLKSHLQPSVLSMHAGLDAKRLGVVSCKELACVVVESLFNKNFKNASRLTSSTYHPYNHRGATIPPSYDLPAGVGDDPSPQEPNET
jgi:hypothetical protein